MPPTRRNKRKSRRQRKSRKGGTWENMGRKMFNFSSKKAPSYERECCDDYDRLISLPPEELLEEQQSILARRAQRASAFDDPVPLESGRDRAEREEREFEEMQLEKERQRQRGHRELESRYNDDL